MIKIERDALYSRDDLAAMLKPFKVDVDHFIARIKPRKFLRMVWLGEDILAAMRAAPDLVERPEMVEPPVRVQSMAPVLEINGPARGRKCGGRGLGRPGAKLQAHLKSLKG